MKWVVIFSLNRVNFSIFVTILCVSVLKLLTFGQVNAVVKESLLVFVLISVGFFVFCLRFGF